MTQQHRWTHWGLALLAAGTVLIGGACGSDTVTASTSKTEATTTTEASPDTTTTRKTSTTTTTTGLATDPTTTVLSSGGNGTDATTAPGDVTWSTNAADLRGQDGKRFAYSCSAAGTPSTVWGSGPYTDDSSVCTAGVHAGVITVAGGGRVVIEISPGEPTYQGTVANGVTTSDYGSWSGSYKVLK